MRKIIWAIMFPFGSPAFIALVKPFPPAFENPRTTTAFVKKCFFCSIIHFSTSLLNCLRPVAATGIEPAIPPHERGENPLFSPRPINQLDIIVKIASFVRTDNRRIHCAVLDDCMLRKPCFFAALRTTQYRFSRAILKTSKMPCPFYIPITFRNFNHLFLAANSCRSIFARALIHNFDKAKQLP